MFRIYLENLKAYTNGESRGRWLDLPMDPEEFRAACNEILGDDEYIILDYDTDFPVLRVGEFDYPEHVNILSGLLQKAESWGCGDAIRALLSYEEPRLLLTAANYAAQAEDIAYYSYSPDCCETDSDEEKLGYTVAVESGLYSRLEDAGITSYFDFDEYGRDLSLGGLFCMDNGYINTLYSDPEEGLYSWEELAEMAF